ncbi:Na+/H+ antiporter subunit A [Natronoglycomyces albus]|uniref:Na+/H+ antiporter subunit A n=1 Tax=Natronoglycomyces albus TaxID=2811108 RepID=A0A895XUG1_9ACTN|nr:Na+/H+ antiporter subunit A [Natronoglycomyces albus]
MLGLLASYAAAAVVAPALVRWWGPRALYAIALVPAATFAWALSHARAVYDGGAVIEIYPWVPQLDLELAFHMGTFGWFMVLIVSGIGTLVLIYSARYFQADSPSLSRFTWSFIAFAGAMFGLVISDDLLMLYIFWELTTVFSYLLIGMDPERRAARRAAMQALLVTTLGGLAMLVGFIMLGQHAGSYRLSEVVASVPEGTYLSVALVLILLGALSKSAIFPFSFWLPAAMAAPTPVSAYLHAAAMVKAGVFLIGMLAPVYAANALWQPIVLTGGAITMFFGAWAALRQRDLKLLAAYGTVSQLGLITIVLGAGGANTAVAGVALLLSHAMFKAALFLIVGVIDRTCGTRDIWQLSGLGRQRPFLLFTAVLAVASMVGFPPLFGFIAKEAALSAFIDAGSGVNQLVVAALVGGSALTVAYGLRFLWGAFAPKPGVETIQVRQAGFIFMLAPVLLAALGLVSGMAAPAIDRAILPYAQTFAEPVSLHLALWHGYNLPLLLSLVAFAAGAGVFALSQRWERMSLLKFPRDGSDGYRTAMSWIDRAAVEMTGATQRGSLPFYLGLILLVMIVTSGAALVFTRSWPQQVELFTSPIQVAAALVIIVVSIFAAGTQRRLTAVILVGVAGYAVAGIFVLHGAPDLALTQFLVETATVVLFVLVLRRMPANFSERPVKMVRWARIGIGIAAGIVASLMAFVAVGGREAIPVSTEFPDLAYYVGGGANVVNVTLVDIRVWDTMGEVAVLVVAATGVASLIFGHSRALRRRGAARPTATYRSPWLAGASPEAARQAIILQVVTRILFHAIILFSIYLLFAGHNTPGGGFAGGLVAGLALVVRYLAGGRHELNAAAPVDAGRVLGIGLFIALGAGATSLFFGREIFESAVIDLDIPILGNIHAASSAVVDIGVYLIVIGLILDILRSLGAEIDRQQESSESEPDDGDDTEETTEVAPEGTDASESEPNSTSRRR